MITLNVALEHVDSSGAIFTMTVVGDPNNAAAGSYRVEINKPVDLSLFVDNPTTTLVENNNQGDI